MNPPDSRPSFPIEILLVEDNPHDAEMTMRALKKHNLANRLAWVRDGAEALEFLFGPLAAADPPLGPQSRLILLDLKLPKVDGLTVLSRVKGDPRTQTIPVVILTSSQEESDIVRSYAAGVNSYIVKPVDFEKFTKAVSQLGLYWLIQNQPPRKTGTGSPLGTRSPSVSPCQPPPIHPTRPPI
jgi:two-component system, response regulator